MKTQIEQANTELAHLKADAAKIKNALALIGEIESPALTGISLLEYAVNVPNGAEYILKYQKDKQESEIRQKYELVRDTLKGLVLASDGERLDFKKYRLNEEGQVEIISEPDIINELK